MAQTLEVELKNLGRFSLDSKKPSLINSTCMVYAESEVVSFLASGECNEDIVAGLHQGALGAALLAREQYFQKGYEHVV